MRLKEGLGKLLLSKLPFTPCNVILINCDSINLVEIVKPGCGVEHFTLDTIVDSLALKDNPEGNLNDNHKKNNSSRLSTRCCDLVIIDSTSQNINPLIFFGIAYNLLTENGRIIMIEEIFETDIHRDKPEIPVCNSYLPLAERCGLELNEQTRLLLSTKTYSATILSKKNEMRYRVSSVISSNISDLLELFEESFGHKISQELWRWKYDNGTTGMGIIIWGKEGIAAHFGGSTRPVIVFGKPALAASTSDVMVRVSDRRVFTKKGPYFLAAASFLETYVGVGAKHLLGFGFPNNRHLRLGEKLGLFSFADKMMEITWTHLHNGLNKKVKVEPIGKYKEKQAGKITDILWEQMALNLTDYIVGVRDWAYIKHRYLNHPENLYDVLVVRHGILRKPVGIIVLHFKNELCELMDVIGPLENLQTLILVAQGEAKHKENVRLYCLANEGISGLFTKTGGMANSLDMNIPACSWTSGLDITKIKGKWWIMSGDTDFL